VHLWNDLKDRLDTKATRLQLEQQQSSASPACCPSSPKSSSWTSLAARSTWKAPVRSKN
jgi:hypothetical protein